MGTCSPQEDDPWWGHPCPHRTGGQECLCMPQHGIQGAQGPVPCLGNIKQNKIKTNLNSDSLVGPGFVDKENPNRPATSM